MPDKNLTVSSNDLESLLSLARAVISSHAEGTLVAAWDSNRIASLLKVIQKLEKSTGLGQPYFEVVEMSRCLEWLEKEFWSSAARAKKGDVEIDYLFQRIKRFSPNPIATLVLNDAHKMGYVFFEYGTTRRVAYWCENGQRVYPSLHQMSRLELLAILQTFL